MFRKRKLKMKKNFQSDTEEIEMQTFSQSQAWEENPIQNTDGLRLEANEERGNIPKQRKIESQKLPYRNDSENKCSAETDDKENFNYQMEFVVDQDENEAWQAIAKDDIMITNTKCGLSVKKSTNVFLKITSIHGLSHLRREYSNGHRFFFLIGLVAFFGYAVYNVKDLKNNPVTVTDINNTEYLGVEMVFPAVTVCNMNKAQNQKMDSSIKLAKEALGVDISLDEGRKAIFSYLSHIFYRQAILFKNGHDEAVTDVELNITGLLLQVMQPCQDMLIKCLWRDKAFNCMDLFRIVSTPSGICCAFNTMSHFLDVTEQKPKINDQRQHWMSYISTLKSWTGRSLWEKPLTVFGTGPKNALTIVLNADVQNYGYSIFNTAGFLVKIHNSHDTSGLISTGLHVSTGRQNFITVTSEVFTTAEDLDTFPKTRDCFYYVEKPLPRIGYYRYEDCVNQCINMVLESLHHCSLHFISEPLHFCAGADVTLNGDYSDVEGLVKDKLANKNSSWESPCACRMNCQDTKFRSVLSYLQFPGSPVQIKKLLRQSKNNHILSGTKLQAELRNMSLAQADRFLRDNIAIVRVEMSSWTSMRFQRRTFFTSILFFANVGGLVALFIGFSVQSFIEALFHLARAIWKYISKYPRMISHLRR